MNLTPLEITLIVVFACTAVFVFGVAFFFRFVFDPSRAKMEERLQTASQTFKNKDFLNLAIRKRQSGWDNNSVMQGMSKRLDLQLLFEQAGMGTIMARILLLVLLGSLVCAALVYLVTKNPIHTVLTFLFFWLFSYIAILVKRQKRFRLFEEQFDGGLGILARSLRAGHPFLTGIQMVYEEFPDPIGFEFERVYQEQQLGIPLEDSLNGLGERIPLMSVRFFVIAVIIHRQTGGDLAEVLDNLGYVIRERFKFQRQVKALTAQGKMTAWGVAVMPIFAFVGYYFVNRKYIMLLIDTEIGNYMLMVGILLEIAGMFIIYKIVNVEM